jgi:hypothetical protein
MTTNEEIVECAVKLEDAMDKRKALLTTVTLFIKRRLMT